MSTERQQPERRIGMSRKEVAKYLQLSPERVRQLTISGELTYTDTPLGRLYHRDSVEALAVVRHAKIALPPERSNSQSRTEHNRSARISHAPSGVPHEKRN